MINLRTGTPGACKTLSAVEALAKMLGRWEKHPEEARPVFVHGVKDLALPHSPMPVVEWREGGNKPAVMVPDWSVMPDGSFVLIDEAQSFFPPRSSAATSPPHVAWLNTHRHHGFDIEVITQHPKLIDGSVRALVGKHQHFRRLFGGKRSYCYEWDSCSDGLSGLSTAVGALYPFPKKAYAWYKSAEIHTKQNFRLPMWLMIPVIGVAIGVFVFPKAYGVISNGVSGKSPTAAAAASSPYATPPPAEKVGVPSASAAIAAVSAPAPSILQRIEDVVKPPKVAGCLATPTRCSCIDDEGHHLTMTPQLCEQTSRELGAVIPYPMEPPKGSVARPTTLAGILPAVEALQAGGGASGFDAGDIRERKQRTIQRGSGESGMGVGGAAPSRQASSPKR